MSGVALVLLALAVPLQLLGLTSTCTQGADGAFISGAFLSGPLLLIAVVRFAAEAIWVTAFRTTAAPVGWAVAAAVVLISLTNSAWLNTIRFGTPCGEEFAFYGPSHPFAIAAILVSYLLLPLMLIAAAAVLLLRRRARRDIGRGRP
jgi:hypothetical protein